MRTRVVSIFIVMLFALSVLGCQSIPQQHRGAATGAGIGAATGAAAGALLGSEGAKTGSAVIGGLVGALVRGAIGHYTQDVKRDRQTTARQYNYRPASGSVLRIEDAFATPAAVRPGDAVSLNTTYAVLTPNPADTVSVTEARKIRHNGAVIGNPRVTVKRNGSTFTSSVPLMLPPNADRGT
ncbi:MAG: hypothetical protein AB1805_10630 [Nitrospirota bacterium]